MGESSKPGEPSVQIEGGEPIKLPMEREQVLKIIPHRPPMVLVDRIIELDPGKSARGTRKLTLDDPWFAGHFPGNPIMPGVLMVEAIAQTGAVLLMVLPECRDKLGIFGGADKVRAKRIVVPGEVMDMRVKLDYYKMSVGRITGTIHIDDELAMSAQIRFKIVDA